MGTQRHPGLYEIENAFQPAKEITDVERFAGRVRPVQELFLALMAEGANIAIVGNRGIGKTSLARQAQILGHGDNGLLKKLSLNYDHQFDFQVIYLASGDNIKSREELLSALITSNQMSRNLAVRHTKGAKTSAWSLTKAVCQIIWGRRRAEHSTHDRGDL